MNLIVVFPIKHVHLIQVQQHLITCVIIRNNMIKWSVILLNDIIILMDILQKTNNLNAITLTQ
jgi:hypothetical protein